MPQPEQRSGPAVNGTAQFATAAKRQHHEDTSPTLLDALTDDDQRRKDDGQATALHAADVRWKTAAEAAIRDLAASGEPFDAETVRARCGVLASPPNALGALFSHARKAGLIRTIGYRTASRPERAGGLLRVWQGVDG